MRSPRPASPVAAAETDSAPKSRVTRAQMASFLVRALDLPAAADPDHFTDDDASSHEGDIDSLYRIRYHVRLRARPVLPDPRRDARPDGGVPVPSIQRVPEESRCPDPHAT